jgi:hypothetical protein
MLEIRGNGRRLKDQTQRSSGFFEAADHDYVAVVHVCEVVPALGHVVHGDGEPIHSVVASFCGIKCCNSGK